MRYTPKNALAVLTVRAFLQYFDSYGVLPLGNRLVYLGGGVWD